MNSKELMKKLNILLVIILIAFITLIGRLGYLQLVETEKYQLMSDNNRTGYIPIAAPRGKILDSQGVALADSRAVYTVYLTALDVDKEEQDAVIKKLAKLLEITEEEIGEAIQAKRYRSYEGMIIKEDVPLEKVMEIQERRKELPGVMIDVTPMRNYPLETVAGQVIGYIREDAERYKVLKDEYPELNYRLGDKFGLEGLERWFEPYLRGADGGRWFEVDAYNNPIRELTEWGESPIPGDNLHITIDSKLQQAAEGALENVFETLPDKWAASIRSSSNLTENDIPEFKAGAVVLIEVKTGRVLAMASKPDFDPNVFNGSIDSEQSKYLFNDPGALNNRNLYPYAPGSTFKMATIGAALENGAVGVTERINDPGVINIGYTFRNFGSQANGPINAAGALRVSSNIYTGLVGERTGFDKVANFARELGFDQILGITLPGEKAGRVPDSDWKKEFNTNIMNKKYDSETKAIEDKYEKLIKSAKSEEQRDSLESEKARELSNYESQFNIDFRFNTTWQKFDTFNNSIGQGYTLTTPLQLASYTAAIANGGTLYKPYLIDKITDSDGNMVEEHSPVVLNKVNISKENLKALQEGMGLVTKPGGTAYGAFGSFPIETAGKTGSAQVAGKIAHGLYVGYAPYDNPEVAAAVIIEHGTSGGGVAAQAVRDLFEAYFGLDEKENNDDSPEEDDN